MRPRLLLKVPAKNYDPAKLLWWFAYKILIGWLVQYYNYYTSIMYEWTLISTLQSDTFSRMFSQCWTHTKAAVKVPSQSVLIDHTCGCCVKIYLNFKGSLTAWVFGLFENSNKSSVRIVTQSMLKSNQIQITVYI